MAVDTSGWPPANIAAFHNVKDAGPLSTAFVNTRAIQAALDGRGHVSLTRAGTYKIAEALIIRSNTRLTLGPGVTIQATSDDNLLRTESRDADKLSVSSATWASDTVTVTTSEAHRFSTGGYVAIIGAQTIGYGGVHRVTVTGSTTFTYVIQRVLTTPATGTMTCVRATTNVIIEGGAWDQDDLGVDDDFTVFGMLLAYAHNLVVRNTKHINSVKYVVFPFNVRGARFENLEFDSGSDGLHMKGPLHNISVRGLHGYTGDDSCAIMSKDDPAFPGGALSEGDIENVSIEDVHTVSDVNVCLLYIPHDTEYRCSNVRFRDIGGHAGASVIKLFGTEDETNFPCEAVVIDGVSGQSAAPPIAAQKRFTARGLRIANVSARLTDPTTTGPYISFEECTIEHCTVEHLVLPEGVYTANTPSGKPIITINSNADIKTLVCRGWSAFGAATRLGRAVLVQAAVDHLVLADCQFEEMDSIINMSAGLTFGVIHVTNCQMLNVSNAFVVKGNGTVAFASVFHRRSPGSGGSTFNFNADASGILLRGHGLVTDSITTPISIDADANVQLFGFELQAAVQDLDVSGDGQFLYNDDVTNLTVGPCTSDGTTWTSLVDGTTHTPA